jgi:hypothetical protein
MIGIDGWMCTTSRYQENNDKKERRESRGGGRERERDKRGREERALS